MAPGAPVMPANSKADEDILKKLMLCVFMLIFT
jgi:hypothetical protein